MHTRMNVDSEDNVFSAASCYPCVYVPGGSSAETLRRVDVTPTGTGHWFPACDPVVLFAVISVVQSLVCSNTKQQQTTKAVRRFLTGILQSDKWLIKRGQNKAETVNIQYQHWPDGWITGSSKQKKSRNKRQSSEKRGVSGRLYLVSRNGKKWRTVCNSQRSNMMCYTIAAVFEPKVVGSMAQP